MARFQSERKHIFHNKAFISLFIFLLLLLLFLKGIQGLSQTTIYRQKEQLETALSRAVTYSYATNGYYPENLDLLLKEYKINYNHQLFYVDYQVLGGNLFPEITILLKEGAYK